MPSPSSHQVLPLSFFFNDAATTEISTLSLHDALPIFAVDVDVELDDAIIIVDDVEAPPLPVVLSELDPHEAASATRRSEEHTSELQSRRDLVCRLLLEKKNKSLRSVCTGDTTSTTTNT